MTSKTAILLLIHGCLISLLFSACQSSKIAYGNSYYFKATPKTPMIATETTERAVASMEQTPSTAPSMAERKEIMGRKIAALQDRQQRIEEAQAAMDQAGSSTEKRMLRKQQKSEKKELRRELKQIVKDVRHAPEEIQKEHLSSNGRLGLILAAIGLVLLLVVPGQIGYILGTILLVVGILLLILDLV